MATIGLTTKLISAGPTMQSAPIVITVSRAFTIWSPKRLCRNGAR